MTHRDLEGMVERGAFRQDLFYRINVVTLWLPPLRARRADIDRLARHFVAQFAARNGRGEVTIDEAALRVLRSQRWPGNVRQLENTIERLVVLSEGSELTEADVRADVSVQTRFATQPPSTAGGDRPASVVGPLDAELLAAERRALVRALAHAGGNRVLAAKLLGIGRSTLYEKLAEHGIA